MQRSRHPPASFIASMLPTHRRLIGALLAFALVHSCWSAELRLRILETSDVHMNLLNYDYYRDAPSDEFGLAKTITLIKAARAEAPNSLLFDNGDLLQGNPLGDLVARVKPLAPGAVHPAFKVLNRIGVDAANIGNHEFNYGLPFLRQALAGARFPYVSANVVQARDPRRPAFAPYVILRRTLRDEAGRQHRLRIGVIGFVPPQIMQWDHQHLQGRVGAVDMVEAARRYVPEMRARGAQLVVALAHSGLEPSPQTPLAQNMAAELAQVPGIDALLLGHAHAEFPGPDFAAYPGVDLAHGRIHGRPAVMPGRWGDHLGVLDLRLSDAGGRWQVVNSQAQLRPIYDRQARRPLVAADAMVAEAIAPEHADTLAHVRAEVAQTELPLSSYFAQVRDDPSVRLVALAQRAYMMRAVQGTALEKLPILSAAAPFKSGGRQGWRNYTDIPTGPLAIKHVADLYIFPNSIKALKLSGREVREWLEMSAGQFRRIDPAGPPEQELLEPRFASFNFDMLEGLAYEIDVTAPARYGADGRLLDAQAQRIVALRHAGRPVQDEDEFLVVTNSYRAAGGGNFPGLGSARIVVDAPDENRQALLQFLAATRLLTSQTLGVAQWRVRPVPGVKLRFVAGAGGIAHLPQTPEVRLLRELGDGSALYELRD